MKVFNHVNEETYHFIMWLLHSGQVDPQALVEESFETIEKSEMNTLGAKTSMRVRDQLDKVLKGLLHEQYTSWIERHGVETPDLDWKSLYDFSSSEQLYSEPESLFLPLMTESLDRINTYAAAQALLIWARKGAPEQDRPTATANR